MTSEQAGRVRQAGHDDAKEFAKLIGLQEDYQNDLQAKKDVVDLSGDAHSVKSGKKKWQIFLYSKSRFENDIVFRRLNGLGELLLNCLGVFPEKREIYLENKHLYKQKLESQMVKLKEVLQKKETLCAFLWKSFFNAGEVAYLTIKQNNEFHIFKSDEVVELLTDNIKVINSRGNQKVVFKVENKNPKSKKTFPYVSIGEIEMRNDSDVHYREIKFWIFKVKTFDLLAKSTKTKTTPKKGLNIYGTAIKTFRRY